MTLRSLLTPVENARQPRAKSPVALSPDSLTRRHRASASVANLSYVDGIDIIYDGLRAEEPWFKLFAPRKIICMGEGEIDMNKFRANEH